MIFLVILFYNTFSPIHSILYTHVKKPHKEFIWNVFSHSYKIDRASGYHAWMHASWCEALLSKPQR